MIAVMVDLPHCRVQFNSPRSIPPFNTSLCGASASNPSRSRANRATSHAYTTPLGQPIANSLSSVTRYELLLDRLHYRHPRLRIRLQSSHQNRANLVPQFLHILNRALYLGHDFSNCPLHSLFFIASPVIHNSQISRTPPNSGWQSSPQNPQ